MRSWYAPVLLAVAVTALPARSQAQVFTPTFLGPRPVSDVGVYLSDGPGDFTIEGIWRSAMGGFDLGLRGGIGDSEDAIFTLGAEYRNPLRVTAPVALAATAGVQALFGDLEAIGLQAGLTIGYTFVGGPHVFSPYLHPRIALVDGPGVGDDFEVEGLADIGLDFEFSPTFRIRVGIGIGDPQADIGVGFAWR